MNKKIQVRRPSLAQSVEVKKVNKAIQVLGLEVTEIKSTKQTSSMGVQVTNELPEFIPVRQAILYGNPRMRDRYGLGVADPLFIDSEATQTTQFSTSTHADEVKDMVHTKCQGHVTTEG